MMMMTEIGSGSLFLTYSTPLLSNPCFFLLQIYNIRLMKAFIDKPMRLPYSDLELTGAPNENILS